MWILNCENTFPCGIFETKDKAEEIILKYKLSGTLTKYPVNAIIFDWAIECGYFTPKNELQKTPKSVGNFSSAYLEHYHYVDGYIKE